MLHLSYFMQSLAMGQIGCRCMQGCDIFDESEPGGEDPSRTHPCRAGKCDADEPEESGDVDENAE